jgi:hypothetical protein
VHQGANRHVVIAHDLTRQPDTGETFGAELVPFRHRVGSGLTLDELDPAGGAFGKSATRVQDVDLGVLLDRLHQPFAGRHLERSISLDRKFRHGIIVCGARSD